MKIELPENFHSRHRERRCLSKPRAYARPSRTSCVFYVKGSIPLLRSVRACVEQPYPTLP